MIYIFITVIILVTLQEVVSRYNGVNVIIIVSTNVIIYVMLIQWTTQFTS